jgi:hypothetical protein
MECARRGDPLGERVIPRLARLRDDRVVEIIHAVDERVQHVAEALGARAERQLCPRDLGVTGARDGCAHVGRARDRDLREVTSVERRADGDATRRGRCDERGRRSMGHGGSRIGF